VRGSLVPDDDEVLDARDAFLRVHRVAYVDVVAHEDLVQLRRIRIIERLFQRPITV